MYMDERLDPLTERDRALLRSAQEYAAWTRSAADRSKQRNKALPDFNAAALPLTALDRPLAGIERKRGLR